MDPAVDRKRWPVKRMLVRLAAFILALPLAYLLSAIILGIVPANVGWSQAPQGITIFVRTNGVHTWIMMPTVN